MAWRDKKSKMSNSDGLGHLENTETEVVYLGTGVPQVLLYDDDDLSSILYGQRPKDPFRKVRAAMRRVHVALRRNDPTAIVLQAWKLLNDHRNEGDISVEVYRPSASIFALLPSIHLELSEEAQPCNSFELHERLWKMGQEFNDDNLFSAVGHRLSLHYEALQRSDDYRGVNDELLRIARSQHNKAEEAVRLSNLGFSYWMEEKWSRARYHFGLAVRMMESLDKHLEHVNVRLNLLICDFEEMLEKSDFRSIKKRWEEMQTLGKILKEKKDWRERKVLMIRARVKEKEGDIDGAIQLATEAIRIGETPGCDWYLKHDREYLATLETRRRRKNTH